MTTKKVTGGTDLKASQPINPMISTSYVIGSYQNVSFGAAFLCIIRTCDRTN